jgi:hypothetical protein
MAALLKRRDHCLGFGLPAKGKERTCDISVRNEKGGAKAAFS